MADIVVMPKLGFNMDVGKLVKWHKREGDEVSKGDPLFAIETDKTTIDVEATGGGFIKKLLVSEGDAVPVTLPIAVIGGKDEDVSGQIAACMAQLGGGTAEVSAPEPAPSPMPAPAPAAASASLAVPAAAPAPAEVSSAGTYEYDVLVVGGGPGGYVAAIKAAQLGKHTCLIEKDRVGGVCLNRGCIPTKTLLRSAEVLKELRESAQYGVEGVDVSCAKLDLNVVQKRKASVVSSLVGGVSGLLKGNGVTVVQGAGVLTDPHTVAVGGKNVTAEYVILATGSESKMLPVPVSAKMPLLTSTEALDMTQAPKSIVIIGGGVIGIEFASFFASLGIQVTVVEFLNTILPMVDEEIAEMVTKSFAKKGVNIITSAKVVEIKDAEVVYEKDGKTQSVPCEQVLMSVGRGANLDGLNCEKLGIKTERGAIVTDEHLRTSVSNIYAIGDLNGKAMLAHVASMEGVVAVENICGHKARMAYDKVPSCIYIDPEIASVGLTEAQARKKYGNVKVGKFPMMANGKAKVHGNTEGLVKIIVEPRYNEIVGAHLYCIHATDMIAELVVAMQLEGVADELVYAIHPHPTVSEVVHEALHAAIDRAIHCM